MRGVRAIGILRVSARPEEVGKRLIAPSQNDDA